MESNYVLKAPKETRDFGSKDVYIRENIFIRIKKHFELYGCVPIDTPVIECIETVKNLYGEEFNKLVYTLDDQGGEKLILRYDLTVPFARYVINNGLVNFKRYQIGKVYRRDEPQLTKGRFREFYQCDADFIGTDYGTMIQDTEILCLLRDILSDVLDDKDSQKFKIKINSKKILFDVLTFIGAPKNQFNTICSSIDKLDKFEWNEIAEELINIKNIDGDCVLRLKLFMDLLNYDLNKFQILELLFSNKYIERPTYEEMILLFNNIEATKLNDIIVFDPVLSRGLDYYTGIVYEAVYYDKNVMSSSIAAGGRYDNMLDKLGNRGIIPAIGLSIGIERIVTILESNNLKINTKLPKVFIATVKDNMEIHKLILANELRKQNILVDYFYNKSPKMRQQLDFVLNNKIPFMVIIGNNEIETNTVNLKIIDEHKEINIKRDELISFLNK